LLVLVLVRLRRFRLSLTGILEQSKTTKGQFLRLLGISIVALLALITMSGWLIYWPISEGIENFSFQELHTDWGMVKIPTYGRMKEYDPVVAIIGGYLIFAFFGFGRDARDMYSAWLQRVGINVELGAPSSRSSSGLFSSLKSKATFLQSSFSRKGSTIRYVSSQSSAEICINVCRTSVLPTSSVGVLSDNGGSIYRQSQDKLSPKLSPISFAFPSDEL
jgi:pheromone a factor receptor